MCIRESFFFQAEDGIRDLVRSRGLGDVYKRQEIERREFGVGPAREAAVPFLGAEEQVECACGQRLSLIHI